MRCRVQLGGRSAGPSSRRRLRRADHAAAQEAAVGSSAHKRIRVQPPSPQQPYVTLEYLSALLRLDAAPEGQRVVRHTCMMLFWLQPTLEAVAGTDLGRKAQEVATMLLDAECGMSPQQVSEEVFECLGMFSMVLRGQVREAAECFASPGESQEEALVFESNLCVAF